MTAALLARARDLLGPIPDDALTERSGRVSELSDELERLVGSRSATRRGGCGDDVVSAR